MTTKKSDYRGNYFGLTLYSGHSVSYYVISQCLVVGSSTNLHSLEKAYCIGRSTA